VQVAALEISATAFDRGEIGEAVRLATSAFLLVGRGMKGHTSILDHLKIADNLRFQSTVPDGNEAAAPLVFISLSQIEPDNWIVELAPKGRVAIQTGRLLALDEWWREIILNDGNGKALSRNDIVRILRDKDGGSHYDANVTDPIVAAALRGEITNYLYQRPDGRSIPLPGSLENTMRQIAEELRYLLRNLLRGHLVKRERSVERPGPP
jgi:hypothetical protein